MVISVLIFDPEILYFFSLVQQHFQESGNKINLILDF